MSNPYEALLAPYATRPSGTKGRLHDEPPTPTSRNPFQRDNNRIIQSIAFRRLESKSQVFMAMEGDHFRKRLTHTLEVSFIARSIARSLQVQDDLAEAVALGHDLGHPPFAHCGEDALRECLKAYGMRFNHNDQSMRIVTLLEKRYERHAGLNLSWEVLEGLAKHNGPVTDGGDLPTVLEVDKKMHLQLHTYASIEAQIGNLADDIAYNSHDLDDGLRAGMFKTRDLHDLPIVGAIVHDMHEKHPDMDRTRMGVSLMRALSGHMVEDVLRETTRRLTALNPHSPDDVRAAGHPVVAFSDETAAAVQMLRKFLFDNMYRHPQVVEMRSKLSSIVSDLFHAFMDEPQNLPQDWQDRLAGGGGSLENHIRIVLDYVSGMTDRYAVREHQKLFGFQATQGLPVA